jgi:predicted transcriptional regulator
MGWASIFDRAKKYRIVLAYAIEIAYKEKILRRQIRRDRGMVRKRAPGAGRPPRGEYRGKSATITTRIKPDTRSALEYAARASHRSLSQEIERRLRESLSSNERQAGPIRAIGELAKIAAERVEEVTGKGWLTDPFTAEAVRHTTDAVLAHFAPRRQASHPIPDRLERLAAAMPSEIAEAYRRPIALALMQAAGITAWIEGTYRVEPPNEWSDPFDPIFLRWQLFRDLGLKKEEPK